MNSKKIKKLFFNVWFDTAIGAVIFGLAVWGITAVASRHPESYAAAVVSRRDMTETVAVSGTAEADQEVSLAFTEQGLVNAVNVQTGDLVRKGQVLASLDDSSLQAQLAGSKADVLAAQANLSAAEQGVRPEELAIYRQKYYDASSALITAMKNAYLGTEDAVLNKSDAVFNGGSTANPVINILTRSEAEQQSIDEERVAAGDALVQWKSAVDGLDPAATSTAAIESAESAVDDSLSTIRSFTNHLGTIANNLSVGNSGMTQAAIDAVLTEVNGSAQEITSAVTAEQTAEAAWSNARDNLDLQLAGSTPQAIQAAQAALAKAQAGVETDQSQIDHSFLTAPFDGTVTNVDFKIGEVYVPGISADESIGLLTAGRFKVEAYVPETDMGRVAAGDPVAITFDSYGPAQIFPAKIAFIDPAATVNDGSNAYKITVYFDNADPRIRSGLSANLAVTVATATDALAVPTSAVIMKESDAYVLVRGADGSFRQVPVQTGIYSSDGYTQIVSGLNEGQIVATFGSSYQPRQ